MKKFIIEFKKFALKSNFLSMAVGVVIGGALSSVVKSFVEDIISPLFGLFVKVNFNKLAINIGNVEITYGAFIMALVDAIIVLLSVFIFVKAINKMIDNDKSLKEENKTKICPYCKSEIDIDATKCPNCTSDL